MEVWRLGAVGMVAEVGMEGDMVISHRFFNSVYPLFNGMENNREENGY